MCFISQFITGQESNLYEKAYQLKYNDQPDPAIEYLTEASFLDNYNKWDVLYERGMIYLYFKNNFEKAIEDFTKAINLNQREPNYYINRGWAYQKQGSYKKAYEDYNKAIELDPGRVEAYYNKANLEFFENKFEDSKKDFDKVKALNNDIYIALFDHSGIITTMYYSSFGVGFNV